MQMDNPMQIFVTSLFFFSFLCYFWMFFFFFAPQYGLYINIVRTSFRRFLTAVDVDYVTNFTNAIQIGLSEKKKTKQQKKKFSGVTGKHQTWKMANERKSKVDAVSMTGGGKKLFFSEVQWLPLQRKLNMEFALSMKARVIFIAEKLESSRRLQTESLTFVRVLSYRLQRLTPKSNFAFHVHIREKSTWKRLHQTEK